MMEEAARTVVERTMTLAAVAAPPLDEHDRARLVASWWREDGLAPKVDAVGNVRAQVRDGAGRVILVCAHLDTVFDRSVTHAAERRDGRLYGPGVGDDTVAVAALSMLDRLLPANLHSPVWIIATVGEEGLGNLTGVRHLLGHPPGAPGALIALEGNYLGRVATAGVGSVRWRARFSGPGGHAWEAADVPSAVHEMGRVIANLDAAFDLAGTTPRASLNVGVAGGDDAVNIRASHAEILVEVRSADPGVLGDLGDMACNVMRETPRPEIDVDVREIGRRPAGSLGAGHPLARAAIEALVARGRGAEVVAASTDANAAYAAGIPAITVGITTGAGEHTRGEWIDIAPIGDGLGALASTILAYDRESR